MHRPLLAVSVALLASTGLAACTSQTQKCSGGICEIDLSGKGANVELAGEGGSLMELVSASGKTATVKLAGQETTLTVGQPVPIGGATLLLEEVEADDDIQVRVTGTGAEEK